MPSSRSSGGRGRFPLITVLVAFVIIAVSLVALLHFSGAKVEITPMTISIPVQGTFTAGLSASALPYQLITAKKMESVGIATNGTKQVSGSASGSITIYNTQAKPQKLIANTQFASPAGLIFRIHSAVTIPAGTSVKPGSVVANVFADAPGPSYNVAAGSFTVPKLAHTSLASAIYARSSTAMRGGASGSAPAVDPAAEQAAVTSAKGTLATYLTSNLQSQIPSGYVLVPGASAISYRELATAPSTTSGQANIQVEGTITGVVFNATALASAILAQAGSTDVGGSGVTEGQAALGPGTVLTLSATGALPAVDTDSFTFTLSGTAALVASIDKSRIASAVAGKSRGEAQTALTSYPEVKRAILVLRPFWRQTFPEDPSSIVVTAVIP